MKELHNIAYFNVALFLLVGLLAGCTGNITEESSTNSTESRSATESTEEAATELDESTLSSEIEQDISDENDISSEQFVNNESANPSSENLDLQVDELEVKETLSQYSSEKIEYARVWLQLGPNQDLSELYVQHIPAGAPLDPNDDTGITYPEDVIQLTGSRLVDGIVTYSGNGDGTINVYNVPRRWYGGFSPPPDIDQDKVREDMEDIINHTEFVYVDPGDDEKVIELIELLHID